MCIYRTGFVTNCRKCKSSIRTHCTLKKKNKNKKYVDNKVMEKR